MSTDAINDEILRIKRALAAKFDNDLARIMADARLRERNAIALPPRRWKPEPGGRAAIFAGPESIDSPPSI